MTIIGHLAQGIGDACLHSLRAIVGHSKLASDLVRCEKANAIDVTRQLVGIGTHHVDAVIAIRLEDFDGVRGADVVALQKDHHLFDGLLLFPCLLY